MTQDEKDLFKDLSDNAALGLICVALFLGIAVVPKILVPFLNSVFGV